LIVSKDGLESFVYQLVREEGSSVLVLHEFNEKSIDWEANKVLIGEFRWAFAGNIDQVNHFDSCCVG
jgi:hypothetical protein